MATSAIDSFLFDIGNVLVGFDFEVASERLRDRCESPGDDGPMETILDLRDQLERGDLDGEAFARRSIERLRFDGDGDEFVAIYQEIFTPHREVWDLVDRLRGRYRLLLLSNTSDLHHVGLVRDFPVFENFEGGVFSYSARSVKPEPAIYETAIRELSIDPARTVYLDDLPANIEQGRRFGLISHEYHQDEHAGCLSFLQELGIV